MTKLIQIITRAIIFVALCGSAFAQTAALLPNAVQQFFDQNGNPLSAGTVTTYVVGTSTLKTTWQNSTETIANTNPIILDAGGKAIIYGDGVYRQVVKDRNGNTIWDAVTSAFGTGGATLYGDGTSVGTVLSWSGITAPTHYAFTYGQELSRTTYALLYAAITLNTSVNCTISSNILTGLSDTTQIKYGAAVEASCIAAGTTVTAKTSSTVTVSNNATVTTSVNARFFPWGNGNGTTTFNVPDLRGRQIAGRDNMGGTAAAVLPYTECPGALGPISTGSLCGSGNHTLSASELATHTHTATTVIASDPGHRHFLSNTDFVNPGANLSATNIMAIQRGTGSDNSYFLGGSATAATLGLSSVSTIGSVTYTTTNANTGLGNPFSVENPIGMMNYIIKITADTTLSTLTVVTSIGGMTGDITCSGLVVCSGQDISVVGAGSGDVVGPSSSVTNNIALFNGITGKLLKDNVSSVAGLVGSNTSVMPSLNTAVALQLTNTNAAGSYGGQIQFGSTINNPYALIGSRLVDGTSPGSGRLVFAIKDDASSSLVNRLTLKNGGQLFSGNDFDAQDFGGRYSIGAYNNFGYQGFIAYSKTSDLAAGTATGAERTAAFYGVVDNDFVGTVENPAVYGAYVEARCSNAFSCLALEVDPQNTSGFAGRPIDPNNIFGTDGTKPWLIGVWISPGGSKPVASLDASAAIGITGTAPQTYEKGIVFKAGSVVGLAGRSQALSMPAQYEIDWYAAGGAIGRLLTDSTAADLQWDSDAGSAQFKLNVSGTNRAAFYVDTTQTILATTTSIPLILKTNNVVTATFVTTAGQLDLGVSATTGGALKLWGATQGSVTLKGAANVAANSIITFPNGTTDFSATGGTSQVVKQVTTGAALTVGQVSIGELAVIADKTLVGNISGSSGNPVAIPIGTGVGAALGTNTNAAGGFVTSPVANANLANSTIPINGTTCTLGSACNVNSSLTNSLSANTTMPVAGTYVDGPTVAQGTSGTWFASGTVTLDDETNPSVYSCKLWDGTTVIASASHTIGNAQYYTSISLSGILATPAANIRISCADIFQTTGSMMATSKDGVTKASTVTVVRIN